jgi:anti-sigma regulatory factor (Ser/Thr protein kinase)
MRAVPQSVAGIRHAVAEYAQAHGVAAQVISSMELAVSEAVSNAVVHAFVDRGEPGTVTVTAFPEDDHICVVVSDDGGGMRPRPDSPGLGVGLPLMTQMTQSLEFREGADGGTEVVMRFELAAAA